MACGRREAGRARACARTSCSAPGCTARHPSTRRRAGDLDFGPAAAFDYDALVLDFHDHYLRGIDNRFRERAAGTLFRDGRQRVARFDRAGRRRPDVSRRSTSAATDGGACAGCSAEPPASPDSRSAFTADPQQPVTDPHGTPGAHDYRALASRDDVLTFETDPLPGELTVAGNVVAYLYASCDCRDFDLWVRLQDVHPDGRAINVTSPGNDVLRASYRDPAAGRQPVEPGTVYELRLPRR